MIDGSFEMTLHPAAVDGTYANRFVHNPSAQLIIGPHVIGRDHDVRTVASLVDVRICGTATHLADPQNKVYMLGMEGELFELDVRTLQAVQLFDLTRELGTPGEFKCHFKDCYTGCGRLVVANNDYSEPDFLGQQSEGTPAAFDGKEWEVLDRRPHVAVHGLGPYGNTIFATGWDRASALLKVFTQADQTWRTYRLPKASHCWDHKWQTEWPRIRATEHERLLIDHHGMWYEMSPWAYGNRVWGIRPISTHLWVRGDFCSWKGMFVIGSGNTSHESGGNVLCAEPQSGIWMGKLDDLWKLGKPKGWGGPWWHSPVKAGEPSDPYLMTGFEHKCIHLAHASSQPVRFTIEIDFLGCGEFHPYKNFEIGPRGCETHVFPDGFSAHWLRVKTDREAVCSAQLHYT